MTIRKIFLLLVFLPVFYNYAQQIKIEPLMEIKGGSGIAPIRISPNEVMWSVPSYGYIKDDNTIGIVLRDSIFFYNELEKKIFSIKAPFTFWFDGIRAKKIFSYDSGGVFYVYVSTIDSSLSLRPKGLLIKIFDHKVEVIKEVEDPDKYYWYYGSVYYPSRIHITPLDLNEGKFFICKYEYSNDYQIIIKDTLGAITPTTKIGWYPPKYISETKHWALFVTLNINAVIGSILVAINKDNNQFKYFEFPKFAITAINHAGIANTYDSVRGWWHVRFYIKESDNLFEIIPYDTVYCYNMVPIGSINNNNVIFGCVTNEKIFLEMIDINGGKKIIWEETNIAKNENNAGFLPSSNYDYVESRIYFAVEACGNEGIICKNELIKTRIFKLTDSTITTIPVNNFSYFPSDFKNYPNPLNSSTTIEFDIPERANVKLVVYDILGREIETLIDKELEPGKYKVNFEAKDLPSGVYFYTLRAPKFTKTNKMIFIK
jgi:hypothetical protein